ncbi:AsmA family protein [Pedobacter polaris]|uniref:AsmA family protein n=1 Tax=Pedobacter polaris TaxID=2571273 RepID=A0A4U1CTF7_9SPHI|nr:AsmA-like C-terminal region-containing protein [Pedobacter polaris]TKC10866.1 AsmA family protein [Pedobacter polaris]
MKKFIKTLAISIISIFAALFIIPYLIPQTINKGITTAINKNIKGEIKFENTSISFFSHFPSLTLNLNKFLLKGSAPFQQDTLIAAKKLSLGINLFSLFSNQIKIDEFYLDSANINILTNEKGIANYNVYKNEPSKEVKKNDKDPSIKIEGIFITNSNLVYNDKSIPMLVKTSGFNYSGQGDLSNALFDLKSKLSIEKIDLFYNNTPYLLNKKLNAKLITKVNTNSLNLIFDENNLEINALPIRFVGSFSFLKDGYELNFKTKAKETDLQDIFSALPAEVSDRLAKTKIKGYGEISASLIGKYIAASNTMPTLSFAIKVRDGSISNPTAPEPISNLFLNFKAKVPNLNPDSLTINMDSLFFNIGKDFVASVTKIKGYKQPEIYTNTRSNINLEKWAKVVNFNSLHLKGQLIVTLKADGKYSTKVVKSGIRQIDTVIATIPKFSLKATFSNGYLKYASLPIAINKIAFNIDGSNTDGDYKNTEIAINNIEVVALNNFIKGFGKLQTTENMALDVQLKSLINFADIKNIYPVKGLELSGLMNIDLQSKGNYNKAKKLFPLTKANIKLANGRIKTSNFNQPLEQININASLTNNDGSLRNTFLIIKPISFEMAKQSFTLKADLKNFENIAYNVSSKGAIDIGNIYQIFAVKGYQIKGTIVTNVNFKGLQSDVKASRYGKLQNSGTITVKDLNLQADLFPKEFLIKNGLFSFVADKMKFDEFNAVYGKSDFKLNGYLSNVINYVLNEKAKLEGNFRLQSKQINADEFMVFADEKSVKSTASKGIILIPDNLNINFTANANNVFYNGLNLKNAKGNITINNGALALKQTGFNIAGANIEMNGNYKSLTPTTATFDFGLNAKEFNIARVYKEIKLFREMASSASKVKGIVGLNYQLTGKLNDEMYPVFSSLKGGGSLTLKKVSLMGFKMMNAISKETKRDSLNNPDLSDVEIKTSIKNNIITIERTKMKVAGFRPRFEGQVSFDGKLNLSGRLGLPPFGIIGIPLSITGTQEKPIVKLKRNKDSKLEEIEEK